MLSDVEIAAAVNPPPIAEVAAGLGLAERDLHFYGRDKAKVDLTVLDRPRERDAAPKLVLVSARVRLNTAQEADGFLIFGQDIAQLRNQET